MALRFDRTATDVLVVCDECPGSWRKGPYPIAQEGHALSIAAAHVRESHQGHKALADQVSAVMRRRKGR